MNDYDAKQAGIKFAEDFLHFINNMDDEPKKFAIEKILNNHPTLQQNAMRFFLAFVEQMAQKEYTDARNDASKKLAQAILTLPEEQRYLPFV